MLKTAKLELLIVYMNVYDNEYILRKVKRAGKYENI